MGGMKRMKRTIKAGQTTERYKFWAPVQAKPRGRRLQRCTPRAQDANEHTAEKRVTRLINCNFTHRDAMLGLSYDKAHYAALLDQAGGDPGKEKEIAEKDVKKFLDRYKYHAKKAGIRLSVYFCVVSDMDGDTGELVHDHAHLLVKAGYVRMEGGHLYIGEKDLEELWGKGSINHKSLWDEPDFGALARYLMRQVRRVPDKAKYIAARGLKKPVIIDEEDDGGGRLRVPKGARILEQRYNEADGTEYIRYVMPERRTRRRVQKE